METSWLGQPQFPATEDDEVEEEEDDDDAVVQQAEELLRRDKANREEIVKLERRLLRHRGALLGAGERQRAEALIAAEAKKRKPVAPKRSRSTSLQLSRLPV